MWSVPAGIIGGRIYFDITTPMDVPHVWYRVFAVWSGGLGIWGAIPVAALVGAWRVRKAGGSVPADHGRGRARAARRPGHRPDR